MIDMNDFKELVKSGVKITDEKGQITAEFVEGLQKIDKPIDEDAIVEKNNSLWRERYVDTFLNGTIYNSNAANDTKANEEAAKTYNEPAGGKIDDPLPNLDDFFKVKKE